MIEDLIKQYLKEETVYWHCCHHGGIYADKHYKQHLFDVPKIKDKFPLTKEFSEYYITSGICDECWRKYHENRK